MNGFNSIADLQRMQDACKIFNPFHSQDLIDNSPYCLSYNAYDGRLENLVLDQLIIVNIK